MLTTNLTAIVENYFAKLEIKDIVNGILSKRNQKRTGLNSVEISEKKMVNNKSLSESSLGLKKSSPVLDKTDVNKKSLLRQSSHEGNLFSDAGMSRPDDFLAEKLF